jgi:Sulfotransferase domain
MGSNEPSSKRCKTYFSRSEIAFCVLTYAFVARLFFAAHSPSRILRAEYDNISDKSISSIHRLNEWLPTASNGTIVLPSRREKDIDGRTHSRLGIPSESLKIGAAATEASSSVVGDKAQTSLSVPRGEERGGSQESKKAWYPAGEDRITKVPLPLKVGFPIFVSSLPKSGTTSIAKYFACGGHSQSHHWVRHNRTHMEKAGDCIRRNINHGLAPFHQCGQYNIYSDSGIATKGGDCFYPSVQGLEEIYSAYPNSTMVLVVRNTSSWFDSASKWNRGSLMQRWKQCNATGWPMHGRHHREQVEEFYDWHTDSIRRFALAHPSMQYIEVQLESPTAGQTLEEMIGISAKCWGNCLPTSRHCQRA